MRTVTATLDVDRAALEDLGKQPFPEGSGDLSGAPATRWRLTRDILGGRAGSDLWCVPKAMMGPAAVDTPFVVVSPDGSTVESEPSPEEVAPYVGENLVVGMFPVGAGTPRGEQSPPETVRPDWLGTVVERAVRVVRQVVSDLDEVAADAGDLDERTSDIARLSARELREIVEAARGAHPLPTDVENDLYLAESLLVALNSMALLYQHQHSAFPFPDEDGPWDCGVPEPEVRSAMIVLAGHAYRSFVADSAGERWGRIVDEDGGSLVETVSTPGRPDEREALQRIAALSDYEHVHVAREIAEEALGLVGRKEGADR